jgi:hypothetical protein
MPPVREMACTTSGIIKFKNDKINVKLKVH